MCGGPLVGCRRVQPSRGDSPGNLAPFGPKCMSDPLPNSSQAASARQGEYTVIARRYRPQTFQDLVGQEHVAQALANAITTKRVGHAYLFTGVRGVGKTSAARILAKALNCEKGPAPVPCNQCDICGRISFGDDMDVLEIDGASNRGIDEIRQLRQNASVRPSRARFKIYIIDEVHMLTREAFNALLKTLEEPPEHVKFIFCTTEPSKIPVTILSRCQRFDFAGILRESIAKRLQVIVDSEGVSADAEALELLARRAAGSMRDGQSLLEQLLAFAPERIRVADVHGMLGSAGEERLAAIVGHLVDRDAAGALADLDAALHEGVDPAQLLEQLFGYFRDGMAAAVGCPAEAFLYASPGRQEEVAEAGRRLGLSTVLAAMQILDQTLSRMRLSTQVRILAELALVRIADLEDLDELPALIARLQGGSPPAGAAKGRSAPVAHRPAAPGPKREVNEGGALPSTGETTGREKPSPVPLTQENVGEIWNAVLSELSGLAAEHAKHYDRIAIPAPNRLVISFKPGYNFAKSICERAEQKAKFEQALADRVGEPVRIEFALVDDEPEKSQSSPSARVVSPQQRIMEIAQQPMIHRAGELFNAHPIRVDDPPEPD